MLAALSTLEAEMTCTFSLRFVFTMAGSAVAAILLSAWVGGSAFAKPYCSQIDSAFCADPQGACTVHSILWRGSCLTGPREFRCVWQCSDGLHYGFWEECECGSTGGGCDCLLAGTMITMADGSMIPIEKIRPGDMVMSISLDGATKTSEVLAIHTPYLADKYLVINGKTKMTENHPVLMNGVWTAAGSLVPGNLLSGIDGLSIEVRSVEVMAREAMVYNFHVADGTYLADGIAVHNKEDCEEYTQYCGDCPIE